MEVNNYPTEQDRMNGANALKDSVPKLPEEDSSPLALPTESSPEMKVSELSSPKRKEKKRKRSAKEKAEETGSSSEDGGKNPKKRLVWTMSLHQSFVEAVNKLGEKGM